MTVSEMGGKTEKKQKYLLEEDMVSDRTDRPVRNFRLGKKKERKGVKRGTQLRERKEGETADLAR